MPDERFRRLEPDKALPDEVNAAVSRIKRFGHLEIHARPPAPSIPSGENLGLLCPNCASPNEKEREVCWACFRILSKEGVSPPPAAQDITLVLDRVEYRSSDPNLPPDIKILMDRIQKEGYSPELIAEWRNTRAAGPPIAPREQPAGEAAEGVQLIEGRRRNIIRIDGKLLYSDDPALPPDMKNIFDYVARSGVTPELMDSLRQKGGKVKFRPANTAAPSDGDLDFWRGVNAGTALSADFLEPSETAQTPVPEFFRPFAVCLCFAFLPLALSALGEYLYWIYFVISRYGVVGLFLPFASSIFILAAITRDEDYSPRSFPDAFNPWVIKTLRFARGSFGTAQDLAAVRASMGWWTFAKLAFWEFALVYLVYFARPAFMR